MVVGYKDKRVRKKEKEGRGFGSCLLFSFLLFCLFSYSCLIEVW